jgi:hypothetical protein
MTEQEKLEELYSIAIAKAINAGLRLAFVLLYGRIDNHKGPQAAHSCKQRHGAFSFALRACAYTYVLCVHQQQLFHE